MSSGLFVAGCLLWLRLSDGKRIGSRTKNTGCTHLGQQIVPLDLSNVIDGLTIWFPTMSWLPSSVKNLTEKPRTSRTVSALPFSPPVVLRRHKTGVFFPAEFKKFAQVYWEMMGFVTSNSPQAPTAFAWTTLVRCVRELVNLTRRGYEKYKPFWNSFSRKVC